MFIRSVAGILIIYFSLQASYACVKPDGYNTYRKEAADNVWRFHRKCEKAMHGYAYWQIFSECKMSLPNVSNKGVFGCIEKADFRSFTRSQDNVDSICQAFKPTKDDFIEQLKFLLSEDGYDYCE